MDISDSLIGSLALVAALLKWLQLLRINALRPSRLRRIIDAVQGDFGEAESNLGRKSNPAIKALNRARMKNDSAENVEEALYEEYYVPNQNSSKVSHGLLLLRQLRRVGVTWNSNGYDSYI